MTTGAFRTEDGCLLAYEDSGQGMPVLWQHGLGADRNQPAEVFPAIEGIRRLTLECRGHGNSELGDPTRLSIATFEADALALLDHLEITQAIVGGISLGAAISMRLAALHPERVAGLILARPAWVEGPSNTMAPYLEIAELIKNFGATVLNSEGLARSRRRDDREDCSSHAHHRQRSRLRTSPRLRESSKADSSERNSENHHRQVDKQRPLQA